MECSLAALIACFSWSNLYIDSDFLFQDHGVQTYIYRRDNYEEIDGNWSRLNSFTENSGRAENPYGRLAIGYQIDMKNVIVSIQAEHTSSLADNHDRGVNGIAIRTRWFPFR